MFIVTGNFIGMSKQVKHELRGQDISPEQHEPTKMVDKIKPMAMFIFSTFANENKNKYFKFIHNGKCSFNSGHA